MFFVIGAINMDLEGRPRQPLLLRDSNVAEIRMCAGGVGRNIAAGIARAGMEVELVAPLGDDAFAEALAEDCRKNGVGLRFAPRLRGRRSGVYLCVDDAEGDMYVALNDMDICAALLPETLDIESMRGAEACALDANLPEETLLFAAEELRDVRIVCDPVSVAKCGRIKPLLPHLYALKPNRYEAQALTGLDEPLEAAKALVRAGLAQAFVSLGRDGMCYADAHTAGFCRMEPVYMPASLTGAGDAATAAITIAAAQGLGVRETAEAACRAAVRHILANQSEVEKAR